MPRSDTPPAAPTGTGTGLRAQYWNNTTFSGSPAVTRTDRTLNFVWRGEAALKLFWYAPDVGQRIVPTRQLYLS